MSHAMIDEARGSSHGTRLSAPMRELPHPCVRTKTGPSARSPGISQTGSSTPPLVNFHELKRRGSSGSSLGSPGAFFASAEA